MKMPYFKIIWLVKPFILIYEKALTKVGAFVCLYLFVLFRITDNFLFEKYQKKA
jgi:hypothetical protein